MAQPRHGARVASCPDARALCWRIDHALGPVAIPNGRSTDWPSFWADNRIRCHIAHVSRTLARRLETLAGRLADLLPSRPPASLLHGDLWGGNILVSGHAVSGLIDPACYFGDREVDVAMLTLFDHPPAAFLDALDLAPGWRDRQHIYRLWPLLVHLRLFGEGYASAVARELDRLGC
jgi:fructosamine-3-kinase